MNIQGNISIYIYQYLDPKITTPCKGLLWMMFSGASLSGINCVIKVGLLIHIMIPITDYMHNLEQEVSIGYYRYWY